MALQPMAAALGNRRLSRTSIDRFMGDLVHYVVMGEEKLVDRDYSIFQLFEAYAHRTDQIPSLPIQLESSIVLPDCINESRDSTAAVNPSLLADYCPDREPTGHETTDPSSDLQNHTGQTSYPENGCALFAAIRSALPVQPRCAEQIIHAVLQFPSAERNFLTGNQNQNYKGLTRVDGSEGRRISSDILGSSSSMRKVSGVQASPLHPLNVRNSHKRVSDEDQYPGDIQNTGNKKIKLERHWVCPYFLVYPYIINKLNFRICRPQPPEPTASYVSARNRWKEHLLRKHTPQKRTDTCTENDHFYMTAPQWQKVEQIISAAASTRPRAPGPKFQHQRQCFLDVWSIIFPRDQFSDIHEPTSPFYPQAIIDLTEPSDHRAEGDHQDFAISNSDLPLSDQEQLNSFSRVIGVLFETFPMARDAILSMGSTGLNIAESIVIDGPNDMDLPGDIRYRENPVLSPGVPGNPDYEGVVHVPSETPGLNRDYSLYPEPWYASEDLSSIGCEDWVSFSEGPKNEAEFQNFGDHFE